jgi:class 3 adenylate cyclase
MATPPTGTVTFLFTDIEGSTRRWDEQPEAMRTALARHDAILRESIERHDGYVFKTVGDAFHSGFAAATDALGAAADSQRALAAEGWGGAVRMALHTGTAWTPFALISSATSCAGPSVGCVPSTATP